MEVIGKIKVINATQEVSASFKKRELVVTTDEQYPQHILIEFNQDKCDVLDKYKVGDSVKVSINLKGREWVNPQGETKYFNSIQGWKVQAQDTSNHPKAPQQNNNTPVQSDAFAPATDFKEEEYNDLPF